MNKGYTHLNDGVAVDNANSFELLDLKQARELGFELLGLDIEPGLLFNVDAQDHRYARLPEAITCNKQVLVL